MSDYLQALRYLAPIFAFGVVIAVLAMGAACWKFRRDMDAAWVDPYLDADTELIDERIERALIAGETPRSVAGDHYHDEWMPPGDHCAECGVIAAQLSAHLDDELRKLTGESA